MTSSQGLVTLPEVGDMVVETSVREADVHRVQPGQTATVRLDAFPDARLTGSVQRVGNMARSSGTSSFDDKRFDVTVKVDPSELDLRPEMTARVDILLDEIPNILMVPVNAVFEREGHYVAHVATPWRVRTTTVELGATNGVYVEVRKGLREGDRLRLLDVVGTQTEGGAPRPAQGQIKGREFAPR